MMLALRRFKRRNRILTRHLDEERTRYLDGQTALYKTYVTVKEKSTDNESNNCYFSPMITADALL